MHLNCSERKQVLLVQQDQNFERRKTNWKKVQLIENKFPFSEIDINDKFDLQMAEFALKILKK